MSKITELIFRCSPEVMCSIAFVARRFVIDTRFAENILQEANMPEAEIEQQRALIRDLTDWENLKRDYEAALLSCGLSYIVLSYVASTFWISVGFGVWLAAQGLIRLLVWREKQGDRYRSRLILIWTFSCVLVVSVLAKIAIVFAL